MPCILPAVFLKLPVSVVQWADVASFQPARDAVEMKCMLNKRFHQRNVLLSWAMTDIANTPGNCTLFTGRRSLVCLTFDAYGKSANRHGSIVANSELTKVHYMVSADSTVIDNDIPCPKSDSIPLCVHVNNQVFHRSSKG